MKWLFEGRYAFGDATDGGAAIIVGNVAREVLWGLEDEQTGALRIILIEK
ncbi:MAG: hypothetical protein IJT12_00970 [Paludibacteraceae bacterium]|nr:hypothetical protein [Paludibacteraceae bacterium]